MSISRPILAYQKTPDITTLTYPVYATPKIDGLRALTIEGLGPVSRKFLALPNKFIRDTLSALDNWFDGEITAGDTFQSCSSAFNRRNESGNPIPFTYNIFDYVKDGDTSVEYLDRIENLKARVDHLNSVCNEYCTIRILEPVKINNADELLAFEEKCLEDGYEGVIIRSGSSPYKCGRTTLKEQYMFKLKRFIDSEMRVESIEALTTNNNELEADAFGLAKRSTKKENLVEQPLLGTIVGPDIHTGVMVRAGSGLTLKEREYYWTNPSEIIGAIVTYKFFPKGVKDKPRHAIIKGIRPACDVPDPEQLRDE